ncbi:S-locus lectin protein kinase family protein [Euphorbia peplus]|nr:S-locus lectin protein kinase family protein [Euphorbia peplus]
MQSFMATIFCLILFSLLIIPSSSSSRLTRGSSLSVSQFLISPNSIFIAGFHQLGFNAYSFSIWFNESSSPQKTIVWTANRDEPVNRKGSKLSLSKKGNLILTDFDRLIWETETIHKVSSSLQLLNNGNLVLITEDGEVQWESFHFPTDTLLPLQPLTREMTLVSSRSQTNFSSGFYKLSFDDDNVFRIVFDGPQISSVAWPENSVLPRQSGRVIYNSTRIAMLDSLGHFESSDNLTFSAADYGARIQRRLTLDFDGNLRLYSSENGSRVVSWQARSQACRIYGACGPNSACRYDPVLGRTCSCLPGFEEMDKTDWSIGCQEKFNLSCTETDQASASFLQVRHVESNGYDIGHFINYTLEMCKELCLTRCDCKGFVFKYMNQNNPENIYYCFPKTQFNNVFYAPNFRGDLYVKVPNKTSFSSNSSLFENNSGLKCSTQVIELDRKYEGSNENFSLQLLLWFAIVLGVIEVVIIIIAWRLMNNTNSENRVADDTGYLLSATAFKRFSYIELKKATQNFEEEIGRGAAGIIYKAEFNDGRVAAIKRLHNAEQGEAEFLAELSTIGKLHHMNLIEMWGYCAEGKHRVLVYEYMKNGSLAKNISSEVLDWRKRFGIIVGTAKGLAYLHEECLEWIIHCDIKPENILLDSDYQPKVSDFGLSWLLSRGENASKTFTTMRGTRGYMAPEWVLNTDITAKVDVYSYGIVVLEIMTEKSSGVNTRSSSNSKECEEQESLVEWVKKKKSNGVEKKTSWINEIIDSPTMGKDYDMKKMEAVINMALQCVEEDKDARPTMRQVVEMLLQYEQDPIEQTSETLFQ